MSAEDLTQHPLNVSTSKQKYSFPKEDRFNQRSSRPICEVFYDLPSTRSRRVTTLGLGQKDIGLNKHKVTPGVGTYTYTDDFGSEIDKYNIPSFGIGREKMELGGPLGHLKFTSKLPGPGNYNNQTPRDHRAPTLKSRLPDLAFQKTLKNPGPGTYNHESIGTQAYYITSKHRNFTNHKISQVSRASSYSVKRNSIGPAQYTPVDCINPVGRYSQSKHSNASSCVFSRSNRPGLAIRHQAMVPGPGQQYFQKILNQMLNKATSEQTYFHNYQKQSRVNNPTFVSHFVNDSLTVFTPQKKENGSNIKQTEYKSSFQPFNDKVNVLSIYQQSHNYARYSKQAFEKNKSYLSQYGSKLITDLTEATLSKK